MEKEEIVQEIKTVMADEVKKIFRLSRIKRRVAKTHRWFRSRQI